MAESNHLANRIVSAGNSSGNSATAAAAAGGGAAALPPPEKITFISGVSLPEQIHDAATSLQLCRHDGFDYVVTALPNTVPLLNKNIASAAAINGGSTPGQQQQQQQQRQRQPPRTDVTRLDSKWWSTSIVGMVADPPHFRKATNLNNNALSEGQGLVDALTCTSSSTSAMNKKEEAHKIFGGMMEWASHMNIPAVILPPVPLVEVVRCSGTSGDGANNRAVDINSSEEEDIFSMPTNNGGAMKRGRVDPTLSAADAAAAAARRPAPKMDVNNASAKEYARILSTLSMSPICTQVQLWVRVPLDPASLQAFQLLLSRCDHNPNVGCMLYLQSRIDPSEVPGILRSLHAFLGGGNVRAVSWDVGVFLRNKKGFPTLSKNHQFMFQFIYGRLGRTLRTLLEGRVAVAAPLPPQPPSPGTPNSSNRLYHLQYLRHLRTRASLRPLLDSEEAVLETPYLDNLQSPLQPLGDHLEYQTYETFEKDPVKYRRYGDAVAMALEDRMTEEESGQFRYLGSTMMTLGELKRMTNDDSIDSDDVILNEQLRYQQNRRNVVHGNDNEKIVEVDIYQTTILVVGAGRGPLVREAIRAVQRVSASRMGGRSTTGRRRMALHAKIVAIEKNPSAVLYLQSCKGVDPTWNGGHEYHDAQQLIGRMSTSGREDDNIVIPGTSVVTVVGCDMREAGTKYSHPVLKHMIQNAKARADIVVSELLGSFGDNELSPECLDGVQRCGLLKDRCVSIPQNYTAFMAPVSSARLHSEAKTQSCIPLNTNAGPASPAIGMQRALETPYVVRSHAASQTHRERPCWTFSHPHPAGPAEADVASPADDMDTSNQRDANPSARAVEHVNNDRHAHLSFEWSPTSGAGIGCGYGAVDQDVETVAASASQSPSLGAENTLTIHGFLGSFHSVLYERIGRTDNTQQQQQQQQRSSVISIAPSTFSVGMFSWFPLFFPLKEPLRVPPGATVNCSVWRRSDEERVWYEWCAEVVTTAIATNSETGKEEATSVVWSTSSIHNPGGRSYHVNK